MRSGRSLVTGVAGFIGSHLAERLLGEGREVVGIDSFSDYYPRAAKEANLAPLRTLSGFELVEGDLNAVDLAALLAGVDTVFHQAGQPGVRASWGRSFDAYVAANVLATQRLLEAALQLERPLQRFVYATSSSVYGDAPQLPASESTRPQPISPYGVTKLAAEHLCLLYARLGLATLSLRYFTVYGPRQRPDMAFHRFIRAGLEGSDIVINGDGEQSRDFTYVGDIVDANLAAAGAPADRVVGKVYNLGGGSRVTVNEVVALIEETLGRPVGRRYVPAQPGDARHTFADCSAAAADLGFQPRVALPDGLRAEVDWLAGGGLR